jgi:hypothetical protein
MYQDKIEVEARELVSALKLKLQHNIFEISELEPKGFIPNEDVCDATHIARYILSKRSNDDIALLSNAIITMLRTGHGLLMKLSVMLLSPTESRSSVVTTQGRALYLLHDYFDLTTLPIQNVKWGELFAILTLMQSAEINYALTEVDDYDESLREAFKQTELACISQLKVEVIDSVARAECYGDVDKQLKDKSQKGGNNRAVNMEPLRNEVGRRFVKNHAWHKPTRAALNIRKELIDEKSELLDLINKNNPERTFAGWIKDLLDKKWQLPVQ